MVKTEITRKELVRKTQEAANLLSSLNQAEANNRHLMDKAKAASAAQTEAEAKTKEAIVVAEAAKAVAEATEVKAARVEEKLKEALESKEAEIKAADEKAYAEGQADVRDAYKAQVNQACNQGYYLGWIATLNKLSVPADSPLRDINQLSVHSLPLQKTLTTKPKRRKPKLRMPMKS